MKFNFVLIYLGNYQILLIFRYFCHHRKKNKSNEINKFDAKILFSCSWNSPSLSITILPHFCSVHFWVAFFFSLFIVSLCIFYIRYVHLEHLQPISTVKQNTINYWYFNLFILCDFFPSYNKLHIITYFRKMACLVAMIFLKFVLGILIFVRDQPLSAKEILVSFKGWCRNHFP